ncbi:MAG: hypothetical protein IBX40_07290 [Methanosarcinales archaeon]|nr:hypothetical protein [Methanosarcinales archaeon]
MPHEVFSNSGDKMPNPEDSIFIVIKMETKIELLRNKKTPGKSYATLAWDYRHNNIIFY